MISWDFFKKLVLKKYQKIEFFLVSMKLRNLEFMICLCGI
jgi:hypothetical protein